LSFETAAEKKGRGFLLKNNLFSFLCYIHPNKMLVYYCRTTVRINGEHTLIFLEIGTVLVPVKASSYKNLYL
jgi:hypothetical protein